jgi:hypothetical protein
MESNAHSSAPQALRGAALRRALRRARAEAHEATPSQDALSDGASVVYLPPRPVAFPEPPDVPDSGGPRALRPGELAVWLETNR